MFFHHFLWSIAVIFPGFRKRTVISAKSVHSLSCASLAFLLMNNLPCSVEGYRDIRISLKHFLGKKWLLLVHDSLLAIIILKVKLLSWLIVFSLISGIVRFSRKLGHSLVNSRLVFSC